MNTGSIYNTQTYAISVNYGQITNKLLVNYQKSNITGKIRTLTYTEIYILIENLHIIQYFSDYIYCSGKLTQKNNVQRQSSAKQHQHWLSVPQIIYVWTDAAYIFNHEAMNNCCKPQVDVAATTAQCCAITQKHQISEKTYRFKL